MSQTYAPKSSKLRQPRPRRQERRRFLWNSWWLPHRCSVYVVHRRWRLIPPAFVLKAWYFRNREIHHDRFNRWNMVLMTYVLVLTKSSMIVMVSWCWYGRCFNHLQAGLIEEHQLGRAACPHWQVSCLFHAYLLHDMDLISMLGTLWTSMQSILLPPKQRRLPWSQIIALVAQIVFDFSFISLLPCHSRNVLNRPRTGSERLTRAPY